ncbi:TRAP transporter substrate-binding protein [Thermodesulfobacteriota bacterium]
MRKKQSFTFAGNIALVLFAAAILFGAAPAQAAEKGLELSFALHVPPKAALYPKAFVPWAKEIEKRTNGKLKFKFYVSQTLVKMRDSYDAVVNGIADASWFYSSWAKGRFPLMEVMDLPYMTKSTYAGSHVMTKLYKKFPEIQKELKDVHPLWFWTTMPYEIHTVKQPIRKLEDMKGLKFATQPGALKAVEGAGAIAVTMGSPDIYPTVEKGVADGSALAWGAYKAYKLVEVTNYHTNAHLGGLGSFIIMNKNSWNKIPKDLQKVVTDVTNELMPDMQCASVVAERELAKKITNEAKHEIIELSASERARWVATGKPAWEKWAKAMEAKGLPGNAVLAEAIKLMNEEP